MQSNAKVKRIPKSLCLDWTNFETCEFDSIMLHPIKTAGADMEILIKCKRKTQNPDHFGIVLVSLRVEKEHQSTKGCVSVRLNHICLRRRALFVSTQECDTYLHTVGGISVIFAAPLENLTGPLESILKTNKK
jgi:hypothetical protein